MLIFMLGAVGTLFVVWVITGVKLILLARRTGALPELLLGASLLLVAGLGFPLAEVSKLVPDARIPILASGTFCTCVGTSLLFAFTAVVFRNASRIAWMVVGAGAALLAVQGFGSTISQATAQTPEALLAATRSWGAGSLGLTAAAWGWSGFESLRHYRLLSKRLVLGLAEPVVVNRMLLYGLMGTIAVSCVVIDSFLLFLAGEWGRTLLLPLATAAAGLAVSVCMILAFWPPAGYLVRVRAAHTAEAATHG